MQIILKEKIRNLGMLGEAVQVKPGYARNYLIPKGKAMMATKANLAAFELERAELERVAAAKLVGAHALAEKLSGMVLTLKAKAGEGGKLFGSIGARDIAETARAQGIDVLKHQVRIPTLVIRDLGEFDIELHLHTDINAQVKVRIEAE